MAYGACHGRALCLRSADASRLWLWLRSRLLVVFMVSGYVAQGFGCLRGWFEFRLGLCYVGRGLMFSFWIRLLP